MKTLICLAAVAACSLALAQPAHARIGESEEQIAARYGQSAGEPPPGLAKHFAPAAFVHGYRKAGLVIFVAYRDGRSAAEYFAHEDKSPLSGAEVDDLLNANLTAPQKWKRADLGSVADGAVVWLRGDGLAEAHSVTGLPFLEIQDGDFADLIQKAGRHPLKGF